MNRPDAIVTEDLLAAFGLIPTSPATVFTGGHINDTFRVGTKDTYYMLQRINKYVFPEPLKIMDNMCAVTDFIKNKVSKAGGNPDRETLQITKTTDGKTCYIDEYGEYWRCIPYINNTTAYETANEPDMLREAGLAFGSFQNLLSDYPADTLHEIIKDFHNTPARYSQLTEAVQKNAAGRLSGIQPELEFAQTREEDCSCLMQLLKKGDLPLRVTHNDTKMSNILFDNDTGKAICVIDLDTVMPGLAAFDFGDSIRAGAATAAEDETDLSLVNFSFPHYEAYAEGFLRSAGRTFTEAELATLHKGAILMTLEVGMRFLADYVNGDVYFKTKYPNHNLDRARNQFKLVSEMEKQQAKMQAFILDTAKNF